MVVSSLIRKICSKQNPLEVWGDGSAVRDFIYSEDVAEAMISIVKKKITKPINIGSGTGYSIKYLVKTLLNCKNIPQKPKVIFDKSKPQGDKIRILDTSQALKYGIKPRYNLKKALELTVDWYLNNKNSLNRRFNFFKK